jgi:hypothetical protein
MAHICNPSYSGPKQEDPGLRSARAKLIKTISLKFRNRMGENLYQLYIGQGFDNQNIQGAQN